MGKKYRFLVVGAGFSGATVARILADEGHNVTVIDQRNHIGGNAYDYVDSETGILIHHYGPHIFHTSNYKVVDFLTRFTEWLPYEHRVSAQLTDGRLVDFPPNQSTVNFVEQAKIIETFYRPYSEKMWGQKLEDIDPEILNRVLVRKDYEDRYFPKDTFQYMPRNGFTKMFEKILSSSLIDLRLSTQFVNGLEQEFDHCFSSMSIDQYYNYEFGILPYRSLKFENVQVPCNRVFPRSVINFTDHGSYTRVTEWKNFPGNPDYTSKTILTFETPCDFRDNFLERYYPIKNNHNLSLLKKYQQKPNSKVTFIGRCGLYAYINMDQAVSSSLSIANGFLQNL